MMLTNRIPHSAEAAQDVHYFDALRLRERAAVVLSLVQRTTPTRIGRSLQHRVQVGHDVEHVGAILVQEVQRVP